MAHADYVPPVTELLNQVESWRNACELNRQTLRDNFAMAALTGELSACVGNETSVDIKAVAKWCYRVADAMMEARKVQP